MSQAENRSRNTIKKNPSVRKTAVNTNTRAAGRAAERGEYSAKGAGGINPAASSRRQSSGTRTAAAAYGASSRRGAAAGGRTNSTGRTNSAARSAGGNRQTPGGGKKSAASRGTVKSAGRSAASSKDVQTRKAGARGAYEGRKGGSYEPADRFPSGMEISTETKKDVAVLISFVFSVILFLGNFGFMGRLGAALSDLQFGLFGRFAFILPVLLFIGTVYLIANVPEKAEKAFIRIFVAAVAMSALCGLVQLFSGELTGPINLGEYYLQGKGAAVGGAMGGLMLIIFKPALGTFGTVIVLISLLIICIIALTGMSVLRPIRERSIDAAASARLRKEKKLERKAYDRLLRSAELVDEYERSADNREMFEQEYNELADAIARGDRGIDVGSLITRIADYDMHIDEKGLRKGKKRPPKKAAGRMDQGIAFMDMGGGAAANDDSNFDTEDIRYKSASGRSKDAAGSPLFSARAKKAADILSGAVAKAAEASKKTQDHIEAEDVGGILGSGQEPVITISPDHDSSVGHMSDMKEPTSLADDHSFDDFEDISGSFADPLFIAPKMDAREARALRSAASARRDEGSRGSSFWRTGEPGDGNSGMTLRPSSKDIPVSSDIDDYYMPSDDDEFGQTSMTVPVGRSSTTAPAGRPSAAVSSQSSESANRPADYSGKYGTASGRPASAEPDSGSAAVKVKKEAPKKPYRMPSTNLLHSGPKAARAKESELRATAIKLQQTLASYGVGVTVTNVSCGPTVTRYELKPDQGVRVNQVLSRVDDIQLNLAAAEIRIEAPIPGKSAIGIEVPNAENQTVYLRELVDSQEFRRASSKVCFAVGRDISGRVIVADIDRMPHLLIAGATGSGKSVCINTIIMSILFKARPDEVRMIMIDPKVVELSVYNGIPHLMIPVVTDPKKAAGALQWAVTEMANRYKTFAKYNVRDIVSYNRLATAPDHEEGMEFMPRILIIVDELADLMMVSPKEVEGCIQRLAQLARAAGLHLILATQRPSVNVITGVIKANVPSRLAFAVSSSVDSRTILDMGGAEKLLGKGDMLFHLAGWPKPVRIQGAFVSDTEILDVVNFLKNQTGDGAKEETDSSRSLITQIETGGSMDDEQEADARDELFERCGLFLIEKGKGTSNILQRTFRIGFNRAARILDQLTEAGVLGPDEGTKPRQVLMTKEEFEEMLEGGE